MTEAPECATLVVFHTAVLVYVASKAHREQFAKAMRRSRAVWISNEVPGVFPDLAKAAPPASRRGLFLLAVNGSPVAWRSAARNDRLVLPFRLQRRRQKSSRHPCGGSSARPRGIWPTREIFLSLETPATWGFLAVEAVHDRWHAACCRGLSGGRLLTSDPSSRQMRVTGILECPRSSLPRCSASARSPSWRPRGHRSHFRQDHRPVGVRQERRRRRAWRSGSAAAPLIRRVRYGSRSKRRGSRYRQVAHVALKASSIDDRRLARSGRSKPCDSRSANSGNMGPSSSC